MINHETRIIELGHGDVCVGIHYYGLQFQNIKPPQEIGTSLFRGQENLNFIGDIIELHFTDFREISEFENKLQKVESGEKDFVHYTDWVIKFNGNKKSIEVVRAHFDNLKLYLYALLAC